MGDNPDDLEIVCEMKLSRLKLNIRNCSKLKASGLSNEIFMDSLRTIVSLH